MRPARLAALILFAGAACTACNSTQVAVHPEGSCALCDSYATATAFVVRIETDVAVGTGVVVDARGHILTNAHVVAGATALRVLLHDGREYPGTVLLADASEDLALLAVEAPGAAWTPAPVLEGDLPRIGSEVFAVGHPLGLGWTISRGIVSSYRPAGEISAVDYVQTDAAISPGNSGGPLLDDHGHVVGLVTSKVAQGGVESLAFARPPRAIRAFLARAG